MKDLKDLNLLDRFLFAEAMEDPQMYGMYWKLFLEKM